MDADNYSSPQWKEGLLHLLKLNTRPVWCSRLQWLVPRGLLLEDTTSFRYQGCPLFPCQVTIGRCCSSNPRNSVRTYGRHGLPLGPIPSACGLLLCSREVGGQRCQVNEIYIGPGRFSHRWPLSQWQNPFKAGEGRTSSESVLQYTRWIHDQDHLLDALPSLHGCTLICDCPHNVLSIKVCASAASPCTQGGPVGRWSSPSPGCSSTVFPGDRDGSYDGIVSSYTLVRFSMAHD